MAAASQSEHIEGHPVNASTYSNYKCRCAGCRAANTARQQRYKSSKTQRKGNRMSVSLSKGGNVSLTKEAPGATEFKVGLGWDARTTDGQQFDLDASAIVCDASDRVLSDKHFVFFNNLSSPEGAVKHSGDNLTGEGGGDDETITVNTSALPAEAAKVVFPVAIFNAAAGGQNFGQVKNAFIRVLSGDTEVTRFDLGEDAATETCMVFGELYKNGEEWKFRAVGTGYTAGIEGLAKDHGVSV